MPRIPTSGAIQATSNVTTPVGLPGAGLGVVAQLAERASIAAFAVEQARLEAKRQIELNRSVTSFIKGMNDLAIQSEQTDDPDELRAIWDEGSERIYQGAAESLSDPVVRQEFDARSFEYRESGRLKMELRATGLYQQQLVASADEQADQLAIMAAQETDPVLRQKHIQDAFDLYTKAQMGLGHKSVKIKQDAVLNQVDVATGMDMALHQPERFIETIANPSNLPGIGPIQRMELKFRAENVIEAQQKAALEAMKAAADAALEPLRDAYIETAIEVNGNSWMDYGPTIRKLDLFRENGIITDSKYIELAGKTKAEGGRRLQQQAGIAEARFAEMGLTPGLDPTDEGDRKKVSDYWNDSYSEKAAAMSASERGALIARVVEGNGMWPEGALGMIHSDLHSQNSENVISAALTLDRLNRRSLFAGGAVDENDRLFATSVATELASGVPPDLAVKTVRDALSPVNANIRKERETIYNTEMRSVDQTNEGWLGEQFSIPFFPDFGNYPIPETYQTEFSLRVEEKMIRGAKLEAARKDAFNEFQMMHSVTEIGDKRWQKYSPERMYGNAYGGSDWIEPQLIQDLVSRNIPEHVLARGVFLEPDLLSAIEVDPITRKPLPTYNVMTFNEAGDIIYLRDRSNVLINNWYPKYTESPAFQEAVAERASRAEAELRGLPVGLKGMDKYGAPRPPSRTPKSGEAGGLIDLFTGKVR